MSTLEHFMKDEAGATAFEYGLLAAAAGLAVSAILPILSIPEPSPFQLSLANPNTAS